MNCKFVDYSDVKVGDDLPSLIKKPTRIQLFRYSAITWNAHRIHYDESYAKEEGYPDVLVQSHLHGAFLTQLCTDWMGVKGILKSLTVSVRKYAVPGSTLTCKGKITDKKLVNDKLLFYIDLIEVNQNEECCAFGEAIIELPN